jgi:predicted regulator of Ras-like GTPase activity (Roadblock/LC7/MglB family)
MTPVSSSSPITVGRGEHAAPPFPAALATLKDIAGITGSFVFTNNGHVVARELHLMFDDDALGEVAERLSRIHDTFAAVGDELDFVVIRFREQKLFLKVLTGGMLCILADQIVNMAALRMASNLVARRIAPDLQRMDASSKQPLIVEAAAPVVSPALAAASEPSSAGESRAPTRVLPVIAPGTRRFRGRQVE